MQTMLAIEVKLDVAAIISAITSLILVVNYIW